MAPMSHKNGKTRPIIPRTMKPFLNVKTQIVNRHVIYMISRPVLRSQARTDMFEPPGVVLPLVKERLASARPAHMEQKMYFSRSYGASAAWC
jgi:hypothetical protein